MNLQIQFKKITFTWGKPIFLLVIVLLNNFSGNAQINRANTKKSVAYRANYERIAAGANHSLEIRNGALWALGYNGQGQLGDGSTTDKTSAVQIGSSTNWVSIAAGYFYTVGIKSDGTLWSWGYNFDGQLGDGTNTNRKSPIQVGSATNWVSVSAGGDHTLAIKSDGTLWAWGRNAEGQLGDGTTTQRTSPVQIGSATNWVSISTGGSHSIGVKADGTLWAWGDNTYGQLGDGSNTQRNSPVQIGTSTNWISISAGGYHTLSIKVDGSLWAWGRNNLGQLGDGTTTNYNFPALMSTANWVSVSADIFQSFGVKANGTLWAWGNNTYGHLGDGTTNQRTSPVQIGTGTNWVTLSAGGYHTLGIQANGTLWAWGANSFGQLGDGTTTQRTSPVQINNLTNWVSVSAGYEYSMGIQANGTLWAWGSNVNGQLGDGTNTQRNSPVQIGNGTNWVSVSAGANYTLGIKSNGTLWAWGDNSYGQLGDGTTTQRTSPVQIGTATDWASIVTGDFHTLGIKSDGTLWAWGRNDVTQLGDGTTNQRNSPVQIGTATNWVTISVNGLHSLGIKSDGTLWAWGGNNNGQLGDGTTTNRSSPLQIGSGTNWVTIYAGNFYSLGIKSDGTLWAWGLNNQGQLGDGTTTQRTSPIQIGSSTNWMQISANGENTLGIKADGTLWAWGYNSNGQLGDGSNTTRTSPVQIGSGTNWVSISTGAIHSIGIKAERDAFCGTGSNATGQLGDGGTTSRNTFNCVLLPAPEINIKGNSISIVDGDITPSLADSTNLGSTATNLKRRYRIINTGNDTLRITNIVVSGTNASEFVVTNGPDKISPNDSTLFTVTFTPLAVGMRSATIKINNNDFNEYVYDFAIQGTLLNCPIHTASFNDTMTNMSGDSSAFNCANWKSGKYPDSMVNIHVLSGAELKIKPGQLLKVHNIYIENGGKLLMSGGELQVYGNIETGPFSPQIILDSGKIVFTGTDTNKIINTIPRFFNAKINKLNGIVLFDGGGFEIKNHIEFVKGIIRKTINNGDLEIMVGGSTNEGNPQSFAACRVRKYGSTDFIFPTGKNDKWARCGISNFTGSTCGAEYFDEGLGDYDTTAPLHHASKLEYWDISPDGGSADIKLYWEDNVFSDIDLSQTDSNLRVAHFNSFTNKWEDMGNAAISFSSNGSITSNNVSDFSPFTFGSLISTIPLPVEFINFTAKGISNTSALLKWQKANEVNVNYFEVERSLDGVSFIKIGKVKANGTTVGNYQYIDNTISMGTPKAFYRIKQVDEDGKSISTNVQLVNFGETMSTINVYPNPFNETLNVELDLQEGETANITITDAMGKVVYNSNTSQTNATLNLKTLASGLYNITIHNNNQTQSFKLMKP